MTDPIANSSPEPRKRPVAPRAAYNPITLEDLQQKEDGFLKGMDTPVAKRWAAILFGAVFFIGRQLYFMAPLMVVVLLGCVLYRLNARERAIAAVPATFAAIRLGTMLGEDLTLNAASNHSTLMHMQSSGVMWLPLFLSACLFFTPWRFSLTSRAVFWQAVVYLISGLLPLEGFFILSTILGFWMFFIISFTLIRDLSTDWAVADLPQARLLDPSPAHS
jgi:hypothetical protein